MSRPFERVYTMTDYYDGPLCGVADFDGRPCQYMSTFDEHADAWSHVYELRPLDADTLALALEDWAIWRRWEDAFHANLTTLDTHPALPADRNRHEAIAPVLAARLAALPPPLVRARGVFRPKPGCPDGGRGRTLEVQWQPTDEGDPR